MNNDVNASSHDLLACFFGECEKQFRFLEGAPGYSYLSGITTYQNNYKIIKPYRSGQVPEPFLAVTRYEKGDHALEILYGDADYVFEMFVYVDPITRVSLKDLTAARRNPDEMPENAAWITKTEALQDIIRAYAQIIRENQQKFLTPDSKLVERALTMRSKLMEQAVRAQYQKMIEAASVEAARAYLEKSYRKVTEILLPFKKDLNKGDLKKLKRAMENIGQSL